MSACHAMSMSCSYLSTSASILERTCTSRDRVSVARLSMSSPFFIPSVPIATTRPAKSRSWNLLYITLLPQVPLTNHSSVDFWFFGFDVYFGASPAQPPPISLEAFYGVLQKAGPPADPPAD